MKYTIVISEGCRAFYTEINGKNWSGEYEPTLMTEKEKDDFIDYLLLKLKEGVKEGCIDIDTLVKHFEEDSIEHDDYVCEDCGDTVTRYIWKL